MATPIPLIYKMLLESISTFETPTGNECNHPTCGPNPKTDFEATGIALVGVGPDTVVAHNNLRTNDIGLYTDSSVLIAQNKLQNNRFFGVFVDTGADVVTVEHNQVEDGNYGIYVGSSSVTYDGAGTFRDNEAQDASIFDLFWDGSGTRVFKHNHCDPASPSKAVWDCK